MNRRQIEADARALAASATRKPVRWNHARRIEAIRDIAEMARSLERSAGEGGDEEHAFNLHADDEVLARVERDLCAMVDAIRDENGGAR